MATTSAFASLSFLYLLTLTLHSVCSKLVLEEGYTVTTLVDGNKNGINPHSVLPVSPFSSDLIILDSYGSAFYTLSFATSQDGSIKKYSGKGVAGFSDGELDSAMFNKPKSFAVDLKGNIYVADQKNHAIRKIGKSGVTTIAGGYSQKTGHTDGPAQNASFSDDFELTFVPKSCALMISDRGAKLVRQINLHAEDCAKGSQPVSVITLPWFLALALGSACLLGLIAGFYLRPYVTHTEGSSQLHYSKTWKHFLILLGRTAVTLCFGIRSAVVSSTFYGLLRRFITLSLSHIAIMFSLYKAEFRKQPSKPVSLLDNDVLGCGTITTSQIYVDQLKDLVCFNGGLGSSHTVNQSFEQTYETEEPGDSPCNSTTKIGRMMHDNLICFEKRSELTSLVDQVGSSLNIVKSKHQ